MNKYFRSVTAVTMVLFAVAAMLAGVPNGYYNSLKGKSGISLKNAIHDVIRPHNVVTYGSLWNHFQSTDVYPEKVNGKRLVWDMYSDNYNNRTFFYPNGTSGLNREHSFPKSWWGGSQNEAYTDINHLYPSESKANTAKSNLPLGVVINASFNNGVCKVGTPQSGMGGGCKSVFEPADEYKGDFARTYFYMATCYQDYTWKYTFMLSNSSDLTLSKWAYEMLLEWSRQDPVSQKEIDRNEAVFKIQNNRNPFIDNPGLEEYIWGKKMGQVYNGDNGGGDPEPDGDPELIYPAPGSVIDFGEIALGKSVTQDVVIKAKNLTNTLRMKLYGNNADQFDNLTVSGISKNTAANGYTLKVTYRPTAVGEHSARLLFYDGGMPGTGVGVQITAACREVPNMSTVMALDATDVSDNGFTANWELCSEKVDGYYVHHSVYNNNTLISEETITVSEDDIAEDAVCGSTYIKNEKVGYTHTYRVQAFRLGYTSDWSNTITLTPTALDGVEVNSPLDITAYQGGILIRCSQTHTNMRVCNMQGQIVAVVPSIDNGDFVELPMGAYLITTDQNVTPIKAVVR